MIKKYTIFANEIKIKVKSHCLRSMWLYLQNVKIDDDSWTEWKLLSNNFECYLQCYNVESGVDERERERKGMTREKSQIDIYLVNIWITFRVCKWVENCIEFIEHFDNFHSAFSTCICCTILTKSNNAWKHQCHASITFWIYRALMSKFICNTFW